MLVKVEFSEKQPDYRYMPISSDLADVFIYNFIEEVKNEEDGNSSFIYELNEFRINRNEITEEMIKANPSSYLNYSTKEENIALEERVSAIEDALVEMAGAIYNG